MAIATIQEKAMRSLFDVVNKISTPQRNMLLDHIDKRVQVIIGPKTHTLGSLIELGLVRPDPPGSLRPQFTVLTDFGRRIACAILAQYADRLVAAGFLKEKINITEHSRLPMIATGMPRVEAED